MTADNDGFYLLRLYKLKLEAVDSQQLLQDKLVKVIDFSRTASTFLSAKSH